MTTHTDLRGWDVVGESLMLGTKREHKPGLAGVSLLGTDSNRRLFEHMELYRVRTKSHLYEDWQVDLAMDAARAEATRTATLVADCHACHTTSHVPDTATACPLCRTRYPED